LKTKCILLIMNLRVRQNQPPQNAPKQQTVTQQRQIPQPQLPPPQKNSKPKVESKQKMTIGDAIGLVTIRLGRVEQFIQQIQTEGIDINSQPLPPSDFMDKGGLENLITRLTTLEENSTKLNTVLSPVSSTQLFEERLNIIECDVKDTKDLLLKVMLKFEKFIDDTVSKFEKHNELISAAQKSANNATESALHAIRLTNDIGTALAMSNAAAQVIEAAKLREIAGDAIVAVSIDLETPATASDATESV
jgi:hypothetical protein